MSIPLSNSIIPCNSKFITGFVLNRRNMLKSYGKLKSMHDQENSINEESWGRLSFLYFQTS